MENELEITDEQKFEIELSRLITLNIISQVDEYMIRGIAGVNDRLALLAIKYKQWKRRSSTKQKKQTTINQEIYKAQGSINKKLEDFWYAATGFDYQLKKLSAISFEKWAELIELENKFSNA